MTNSTKPVEWTRPFHGLTHLGYLRDVRRVTVERGNGWSILKKWQKVPKPGTSMDYTLEVTERTFRGKNNFNRAKRAGERWIKGA